MNNPTEPAQDPAPLPHSIEAEQAIIGSLLFNNDIYDHVGGMVKGEHFYDPVHGRLFNEIAVQFQKNAHVSPITLGIALEKDEGFIDLGGRSYLSNLASAVSSVAGIKDYARTVYDMALRRGIISIGEDMAERARAGSSVDAGDYIAEAEADLYGLQGGDGAGGQFQGFVVSATDAIKQISAAYSRDATLAGLSTGLDDLDAITGGLQKSDLLILAGRPSMGKTALATNIAFHVAKTHATTGGRVGFFSLEMSSEQLAGRILSESTGVQSYRLRSGNISEDEFRNVIVAAQELKDCPLFIDDTPALPINQLATRARRLQRTHGLDLLVVDYLQLVRPVKSSDNRVNEVSAITQGLKAIAKELDIPVIALSQLSRKVEDRADKKPQLADLRESGSIEQDADIVMFVYRAEYYLGRTQPDEGDAKKTAAWHDQMEDAQGKAEIIIGKQRHGSIGEASLLFDGDTTKFSNGVKQEPHDAGDF